MTNQTNNEKSKNGKRLALILVALLLIAAVAFGAFTYSRYITEKEGTGSATVAKWGYVIDIGSAAQEGTSDEFGFSQYYNKVQSSNTASVSAQAESNIIASTSGKVVAPGATGSFTFSVSGKAEVAAQVSFGIEDGYSDIYMTLTTGASTTIEYHPITFSMYAKATEGADAEGYSLTPVSGFENLTLKDFAAKLKDLEANKTYKPGEEVTDVDYKIVWKWDFSPASLVINDGTANHTFVNSEDVSQIDQLDTLLGTAVANGVDSAPSGTVSDNCSTKSHSWTVSSNNYSYNLSFNFVVTVEQVQDIANN